MTGNRRTDPKRPQAVSTEMHFNLVRDVEEVKRELAQNRDRLADGSGWMAHMAQNMNGLRDSVMEWLGAFTKEHELLRQAMTSMSEAIGLIRASNYQNKILICVVGLFFVLDITVRVVQLLSK